MENTKTAPHKSSIGNMDANTLALLAYLSAIIVGWIPGIQYVAFLAPLVLYFVEKTSSFVKFHSMQAFMIQLLGVVVGLVLQIVGGPLIAGSFFALMAGSAAGIGGLLGGTFLLIILFGILAIVVFVYEIIAMIRAYGYREYELPLLGKLSRKAMSRF